MDFVRKLFESRWQQRPLQPAKESYTSLQGALSSLRELTGMTREQLARRLCMTTNDLTNLERRGKPVTHYQLAAMKHVARSYSLRVLTEIFDSMELKARYRRKTPRDEKENSD